MWVTTGLVERLDDDELDAVVCHELGHVRNWDMVVMTVAALVPMVLYLVYVSARSIRRGEAQAVAWGAVAADRLAQVLVLAVSRAREVAADRWSVRCRGDSAALGSALVKIAYGIGEVDAARAARVAAMQRSGDKPMKDADNPADGPRLPVIDPVDPVAPTGRPPGVVTVACEAFVAVLPWIVAIGGLISLANDRHTWAAWCLLGFGASYVVKQALRYGSVRRVPATSVADLLHRLDAGPVTGIPVEVRGRVTGRGMPGDVLSPDLVVADESGFLTLVYTNPLPFGREWFGGVSAGAILGHEVIARGWYFRGPGPWIELRDLHIVDSAYDGRTFVRAWQWMVGPALGGIALLAGILWVTVGIS